MIEMLKQHKAAIYCGIIASLIIIYAIEPLLGWVIEFVSYALSLLGLAYKDRLYQNLATMESTNYAFLLSVVFVIAPVVLASLFMLAEHVKNIVSDEDRKTSSSPRKKGSLLLTRRSKVVSLIMCMFFVVNILVGIDIIARYQFHWDNLTRFNHHMRIVTPYLEPGEKEMIISDWSRMRNESDYDEIYKSLESIAKANKLILPDRRI
ncbi:TPA: hypothetical protein NJY97_004589 [Vibrio parahaemolyticus]|nr:hypothetical protein [Vibrio parahaemolyticus]HCE1609394.1 hypothetical protein [Vibrio parahaemolyticus]HCE5232358.1 hypothetical protein [Vibrio parahaemolyticus]HCG5110840.1 hypothetical protein [Vibrio parahaemolyticus]HCG5121280.1 hypothetical protein [Vibrio parahaemolyticus]